MTTPNTAKLVISNGGGTDPSLKLEHTGSNFIVRPVSAGGTSTIVENTGGGALAINPTSGNVGIGTSVPSTKLDVVTGSSSSLDGIKLSAPGGSYITLKPSISAAAYSGITQAGDAALIFSSGTQNGGGLTIAPWNSANGGLRMSGTGNVGIGSTAPTDRLDLGGGNIVMGWERIVNNCSNASTCTATCSAGKRAIGGGLNGCWGSVSQTPGDNSYYCYASCVQTVLTAQVYCANIK